MLGYIVGEHKALRYGRYFQLEFWLANVLRKYSQLVKISFICRVHKTQKMEIAKIHSKR